MRISALREAVFVGGVVCVFVFSTTAEPLDPPDGPVEPTGATQILDIPFTIDEPGSYRLARDVVATDASNGVTIEADNVTLDLGGHSLNGDGVGADGIELLGERENVTIRNGRISNWANAGVWDSTSTDTGSTDTGVVVKDVTITNVGFGGVELPASQATVRNVVVGNVGTLGIVVSAESRVADSRIVDSGFGAVVAFDRSVIVGCVVRGSGEEGVRTGVGCVVKDTTVTDSSGAGVSAGADCVIENTTVRNSGGPGVQAGPAAVVRGCVSSGNGASGATAQQDSGPAVNPRTGEPVGAATRDWSVVTDRDGNQRVGMPDAESEGADAGPDGFQLGANSVIKDSAAVGNAEDGIAADTGSHIENCTSSQNGQHGVHIGFRTTVFKCTIDVNSGSGVVVEATDNRIDSNTITDNDGSGIVLIDVFNRVVRNDLSLDGIVDNAGGNNLPPENDYSNPWSNFTD